MKRIFTSAFFILMLLSAFSQYHPMLLSNHVWKITNYGLIVNTYEYSIGDDVVQGNVTYKSLWSTQPGQEPFLFALMLEDINAQTVYMLQGDVMTMVYDFSLEVGDTAYVQGVGDIHLITVTEVTMVMVNGSYRKKITFTEESGPGGYWIEGIGSVYGVPDAAIGLIVDFYPQVTCFYEDNMLAWDNPLITDTECELELNTPKVNEPQVSIYPNPVSEWAVVDMENISGRKQVQLFNAIGDIVYSSSTSLNRLQIDMRSLASGSYIASITTENGLRMQKLIVH